MKKLWMSALAFVFCVMGAGTASAVPVAADVLVVVDESGSMSGEHAWLGGMVTALEAGLIAATVGDTSDASPEANLYSLVGFGGASPHYVGHTHQQLVPAASFNAGSLVINGGTEDGYSGMTHALGHPLRANAATNVILITDEDRDNVIGGSAATMASLLARHNAILNAVVDFPFYCGDGSPALGIDSAGNGYQADGSGGFTTCANAYVGTWRDSWNAGTNLDYIQLALGTGGAAWDLLFLRSGGTDAQSFSNAFVDIKVEEIIFVPEPASMALLGIGLAGMGFARRRKAA